MFLALYANPQTTTLSFHGAFQINPKSQSSCLISSRNASLQTLFFLNEFKVAGPSEKHLRPYRFAELYQG
jgi:hypothetical protein